MSAESFDTYLDDPVYQSALTHVQSGEWEAGLSELDRLVSSYPLNHQLRNLRQEMKLRAQVDEDEKLDNTQAAQRNTRAWATRILVFVVLFGLMVWGVGSYSTWIRQQMALARQSVENQVQVMELAVKFRDAQDLMQVGRLVEAKALFEEIAAKDSNYPELAPSLKEIDKMLGLEAQYDEALRKINLGDMTGALDLLEGIEAKEPFYKDVTNRIAEIKGQFFLGEVLAQGDKAYQAKDWKQSASSYETLRALNPSFQTELVESRLFESYMNAAVETLSSDSKSLDALEQAETYFRKALSLRPQDPVIKLEREQARQSFKDRLFTSYMDAAQTALVEKPDSLEALAAADEYYMKALDLWPDNADALQQRNMAHLFIEAQTDFSKERYNNVIEKLEQVFTDDPGYASGTARQTLFEAYMARGDDRMLSGDYEPALEDFQRAAVLAEQGENARIRLFQAQIRIAEAMGSLLMYEDAVLLYRTAIDNAQLSDADLKQRPELVSKLNQADGYLRARSYRSAFRVYRDQARKILFIFPQVTYQVASGDYLTMIASRYNTTVDAILQANNLGSTKKITIGQELVIPVQQQP
jgi:tetratricopeptide (TPR) repeat protein